MSVQSLAFLKIAVRLACTLSLAPGIRSSMSTAAKFLVTQSPTPILYCDSNSCCLLDYTTLSLRLKYDIKPSLLGMAILPLIGSLPTLLAVVFVVSRRVWEPQCISCGCAVLFVGSRDTARAACVCVSSICVFVCEDVSRTLFDVYFFNGEQRAIQLSCRTL